VRAGREEGVEEAGKIGDVEAEAESSARNQASKARQWRARQSSEGTVQ
jgi:hypothetical protein